MTTDATVILSLLEEKAHKLGFGPNSKIMTDPNGCDDCGLNYCHCSDDTTGKSAPVDSIQTELEILRINLSLAEKERDEAIIQRKAVIESFINWMKERPVMPQESTELEILRIQLSTAKEELKFLAKEILNFLAAEWENRKSARDYHSQYIEWCSLSSKMIEHARSTLVAMK